VALDGDTKNSTFSEKVLKALIVKELKEVQKTFGDERRTQIIEDTGEIRLEDLVQMEDVAVTVSRGAPMIPDADTIACRSGTALSTAVTLPVMTPDPPPGRPGRRSRSGRGAC